MVRSAIGAFNETYSELEKKLCVEIADYMQMRENQRNMRRDDMDSYVRAAGSLYELAKKLVGLNSAARYVKDRTVGDWLRIMTGQTFRNAIFIEAKGEQIEYITCIEGPNGMGGVEDVPPERMPPAKVTYGGWSMGVRIPDEIAKPQIPIDRLDITGTQLGDEVAKRWVERYGNRRKPVFEHPLPDSICPTPADNSWRDVQAVTPLLKELAASMGLPLEMLTSSTEVADSKRVDECLEKLADTTGREAFLKVIERGVEEGAITAELAQLLIDHMVMTDAERLTNKGETNGVSQHGEGEGSKR